MRTKLFPQAPPVLIVAAVLVFLGVLICREASTTEDLPVFFPLKRDVIHVEMIGNDLVPGVYQFYDGLAPLDVMKLTDHSLAENSTVISVWSQPLHDGECLEFIREGQGFTLLRRGWMTASHRIALAIPLHPDRMSRTDWKALPGAGDVLAERIEIDRQKNGDFGCLEALIRVKGIGEKKISRWREFFYSV